MHMRMLQVAQFFAPCKVEIGNSGLDTNQEDLAACGGSDSHPVSRFRQRSCPENYEFKASNT